jgi:hypothetical protein
MRHHGVRRAQRTPMSSFAGFLLPAWGRRYGSSLVSRFGLSYRDNDELLAERGIDVDHPTIYRWVQRFIPLRGDAARPRRHAVGDRWRVDETHAESGRPVALRVSGHRPARPGHRRLCQPAATPRLPVGSSPPPCATTDPLCRELLLVSWLETARALLIRSVGSRSSFEPRRGEARHGSGVGVVRLDVDCLQTTVGATSSDSRAAPRSFYYTMSYAR